MCPVCGEPMLAYQWQAVEIDGCPRCGGLWLDAGEIEALLEQAGLSPGPIRAALAAARDGVSSRRRCPRGPHRLRQLRLPTTPELILDRCRMGHGLWFDRGEVAQLVRSFTVGEEGLVARFLADLFREDAATAAGREDAC